MASQPKLYRTSTVLEECQEFLSGEEVSGSPIEYYLSQYSLIALCAEMEERLEECVVSRARDGADSGLGNYVQGMAKVGRRGLNKGDISKYVGLFGEQSKAEFNDALDDSRITKYNNAITARHHVAHSSGSSLTLREVREAMDIAEEILEAVHSAIAAS